MTHWQIARRLTVLLMLVVISNTPLSEAAPAAQAYFGTPLQIVDAGRDLNECRLPNAGTITSLWRPSESEFAELQHRLPGFLAGVAEQGHRDFSERAISDLQQYVGVNIAGRKLICLIGTARSLVPDEWATQVAQGQLLPLNDANSMRWGLLYDVASHIFVALNLQGPLRWDGFRID